MPINAVLAELSIRGFGNTKQDKRLTEETKANNELGDKAGRWTKNLLPPAALENIRKATSAARNEHIRLTLPWGHSVGMLAIPGRAAYEERMARMRGFWSQAVEAFLAEYSSTWIEAAKGMHKGTFEASDYPTVVEARRSFGFRWTIFPVPDSTHFDGALRSMYGEKMEEEVNERVRDAVAELWDRMMDPVRKMAERLSSPDAVFRDSLVENVQAIVEMAPVLNLTGDSRINQATEAIRRQLASFDPKELRKDPAVRRLAANAANGILRTFGALGSRNIMLDPEPEPESVVGPDLAASAEEEP